MTLPFRVGGPHETVLAELDLLTTDIRRFRAGSMPEHVFLEKRLRHGIYGQRQDGVHMMRSKLPLGLIAPPQMVAFADIADTWGSGIAHLTTRQDIQVHFVRLEATPDLLRALDAADMSAREACGNVVRNVTASETSGIVEGEAFDPTPHALALAGFLLRHPDGQALGRKFKVTFANVDEPSQNLSAIHDLGFTAIPGGFRVMAGGGLGAVPHPAQLLYDFVPAEEIYALSAAVLRVFAVHGEKKNRARARLKFLIADRGLDWFRAEVEGAREPMSPPALPTVPETPSFPASSAWPTDPHLTTWLRTNVRRQRQEGYAAVKVRVPRGDLDGNQLRGLATLLSEHVGDTTRITRDQALLVRFVAFDHLPALHAGLSALGLAGERAGGLGDTVTCPGADTCKLGITSPRSTARAMQDALDALAVEPAYESLRVHMSGCPNGCAQHQIADIGFYGAARTVEGVPTPHYLVILGGEDGGAAFGTALAKVPASRVGETVTTVARRWREEAGEGESVGGWVRRMGREHVKAILLPLQEFRAEDSRLEAGSTEPFRVVRGVGECAGEVVDVADFHLADADREVEAAQDALAAAGDPQAPARAAFLHAARALLAALHVHVRGDDETVAAFRTHIYDGQRIYEGVGFYFLQATSEGPPTGDRVRRLVEEASLFTEEAHAFLAKMRAPK